MSIPHHAADRPRIALIALGGTIAGTASSPVALTDYDSGKLEVDTLLHSIPELSELAHISAEQFANMLSDDITVAHWIRLACHVNSLLHSDLYDGVVITHGTDTLEETAYFLQLTVNSDKPVVLVGAMRPATALSADGPLNLLNAVATAASPLSRGRGTLIVMNGQICSARTGTKTNTLSPETFKSPELGFLGYVIDLEPRYYLQEERQNGMHLPFSLTPNTVLPRVTILFAYADMAPELLACAMDTADGLVFAGAGNGRIATHLVPILVEGAHRGIKVVRASRTGSGVVTSRPDDIRNGFIAADNLSPAKARILLMLAMSCTQDTDTIRHLFTLC